METNISEDLRMLEETIACVESALHYVNHLPAGRLRDGNAKRLELTLASLIKAHCKLTGNVSTLTPIGK